MLKLFEDIFDVIFNPVIFFKKKCLKPDLKRAMFSFILSLLTLVVASMPVFRYILLPLKELEAFMLVTVITVLYFLLSVGLYLLVFEMSDRNLVARKLMFTFIPFMFLPVSIIFLDFSSFTFKAIGIGVLVIIFFWTFFLERLALFPDGFSENKKKHLLIKILKDGTMAFLLILFIN
ncbi:MAG: hypothetical protein PWQ20_1548 [Thermotogaceae bacterium]|nr:hypothetical protein [Thermotogaceae bacterium]